MKMEYRIVVANITSWMATIISLEFVKDALQILAFVGSISVSIASVWWIKRQADNLNRKQNEPSEPSL